MTPEWPCPTDLSIIAFHDAKIAEYLSPPLATIWMPLFELGEAATKLLVRVINGKDFVALERVQNQSQGLSNEGRWPPEAARRGAFLAAQCSPGALDESGHLMSGSAFEQALYQKVVGYPRVAGEPWIGVHDKDEPRIPLRVRHLLARGPG